MTPISAQPSASTSSVFSATKNDRNSGYRPTNVQPFSRLLTVGVLGLALCVNRAFAAVPSILLTQTSFSDLQNNIDEAKAKFESVTRESGVVVQGLLQDGNLHGYGIKTYLSGGTDEGMFEHEKFVFGTRTYPENDGVIKVLTGTFVDDELDGDNCFRQFFSANEPTKLLHEEKGAFHQRVLVHGTKTYPNGVQATGKFDKEGNVIEGEVKNLDGMRLIGTFDEYRLRGENCELTYPDGTIERGTFDVSEGHVDEQGNYMTGLVEGERVYPWGLRLIGTFDYRGKLHGENCMLIHPNGEKLQGRFINGTHSSHCSPGSGLATIDDSGYYKFKGLDDLYGIDAAGDYYIVKDSEPVN